MPWVMTCLVLVSLAGCGNEAPTYLPGDVVVTSTPAGAAVFLDGLDTGHVTPYTLVGLEPNRYVITVSLPEFVTEPPDTTIELRAAGRDSLAFTLSQTGLRITSAPGARILIDGTDTGKTTPTAIAGLAPGTVTISLLKDTYHIFPGSYAATVVDKQIVDVPDNTFRARSRRTVMLEGFANVSCGPCPELTDNLLAMAAKPEFTADRVMFLEFSVSWPELGDPFYLANTAENAARYTRYFVLGAPDLYRDGVRLADPLAGPAMEDAVRSALLADPGVLVDVTADFATESVPVKVVLTPFRDLDLTGYSLFVAVFENFVDTGTPPGLSGQTEFHHVFRDRVDTPPALGMLTTGNPVEFDVTVRRSGVAADNITAVAFIQHDTNHSILQAGSTVTPVLALERIRP